MRLLIAALVVLLGGAPVFAQNTVSASGTWTDGSSVTLTVTGAGTKARSTQVLWDTMSGTHGTTDLEGRNPAGPGAWLVYGGSAPEPSLSNVVVRDAPGRVTSVFMRETGSSVPGFCAGTNGESYLTLTAASSGNEFLFADGPITLDYWIHYTKPSSTNNLKLARQHSLENPDAGNGNRGFLWFVSGSDSAEAVVHGGMNTAFTLGDLSDTNWHHVQYLQWWDDVKANMFVRFTVDHVMYADTDPPGEYNSPQGGFSEGDWLLLPSGDQMGTLCLESQGHSGSGSNDESYYAADIFMDEGYNRVYSCTHATIAGSTRCEIQPYTAWSDTSITITANRGESGATDTNYIILCNTSDTCDGTGFQFAWGDEGGEPPASGGPVRVRRPEVAALIPIGIFFWRRRRHFLGA